MDTTRPASGQLAVGTENVRRNLDAVHFQVVHELRADAGGAVLADDASVRFGADAVELEDLLHADGVGFHAGDLLHADHAAAAVGHALHLHHDLNGRRDLLANAAHRNVEAGHAHH